MSTCRSCGAPIRWGVTAQGELMPIDAEPNPAGNVRITDEYRPSKAGTARLVIVLPKADQGEMFADDAERYMPHHATCPDGAKWRKKR